MERRQPTAEVLSGLESKVLGRIEALVPTVDRLQRTKHLLRAHLDAKISIAAQEELAARSTKESHNTGKSNLVSEEDEVISGFDKLDGILSLAKEIRANTNKSSKSGPHDPQKDTSGKPAGRQSLRDALSVKDDTSKGASAVV